MLDSYARWWWRRGDKKSGFFYEDALGRPVRSALALERIASLKIPPAWVDVRIAPTSATKLQAVGFDSKGRRQYIYHPEWVERQARQKFAKIAAFVRRLPHFRQVTSGHLQAEGLGREKVLALVSRLMTEGCFRVGGEQYATENRTYGIATLRMHHVALTETCLSFSYRGKRGVDQSKVICDEELAAVMRDIVRLPGRRLFKYRHEDGTVRHVTGRELNSYIKDIMGPEFSAKDFRTWGGTLMAARWLAEKGPAPDARACKKTLTRCVKEVAGFLGNTPAIARASYIAPVVFSCYEQGITLPDLGPQRRQAVSLKQQGYTEEEWELIRMLSLAPDAPAERPNVTMMPEKANRRAG